MNLRITALVPMRHESERVPGKNYRQFAGRPLYHHIVESLLECPQIDEVVIDTDSKTILEDAAHHFPQVTMLERPQHLRAGTVPMNDVLLHDVGAISADFYLQTHSTNPLLTSATISRAVQLFLDNQPKHDSLFSVTRMHTRLWDAEGGPINHDPGELIRTQDLAPIFEENSCLYIFSRESLEKYGHRIGKRPLMFEIERLEAWDIDEKADFTLAELLYLNKNPSRSDKP